MSKDNMTGVIRNVHVSEKVKKTEIIVPEKDKTEMHVSNKGKPGTIASDNGKAENIALEKERQESVASEKEDAMSIFKLPEIDMIKFQKYDEFICGWGAAFVNIGITFPLNKVMFRQQLHGVRVTKAVKQLQKEGGRHLYRGLLNPLLQKTTSSSLMFGSYYKIQHTLFEEHPQLWRIANRTVSAMSAGTLEAMLCPFERIQVLMQDRQYQNHFDNTAHAFKEVRRYGLKEYYRGFTAVVLRNGPSNIPFFLVRDFLMETLPVPESQAYRISQDFFFGAILGAFISTVFYPVNVVKVKMQCKLGGEYDSFMTCFRRVWIERDRSIKKLFRGVQINFTRSFISWGIINATYELLMRILFHKSSRISESL